MLTTNKLIFQAQGLAPVLLKRASTVELDWDVRQKSRFDATDSAGRSLGVFLPRGTAVRGGDVLVAEDGSMIKVLAAPQAVLKVTHCHNHGTPFDLIRAAYHLGNRHVPIELKPDHLKIEPDHVLADMLRAMHLIVTAVDEPFEPENGAYATGGHFGGHRHDHGEQHHDGDKHDHDHDHADSATPAAPAKPQAKGLAGIAVAVQPHSHVHGPGCNHGHDHGNSNGNSH